VLSEADLFDDEYWLDVDKLDAVEEAHDNEGDWLYGRRNAELIKVPVAELARRVQDQPHHHPVNKDKRLLLVFPFFNGSAERWPQVSLTLPYYRRYLNLFQVTYQAVIMEQTPGKLFNRGTMFNIAYDQFKNDWDYMAFMDVDSLPVFHIHNVYALLHRYHSLCACV
jgi:hypothetical protein